MIKDNADVNNFYTTKYSTIIYNYHQRYLIIASKFKQDI